MDRSPDRRLYHPVQRDHASRSGGRTLRAQRRRSWFDRLFGPPDSGPFDLSKNSRPRLAPSKYQAPRTINGFFLITSLAIMVSIGVLASFWHQRQLSMQIEVYLQAAKAAVRNKEFKRAEKFFRTYLQYRPRDVDAHGDLAQVIEEDSGGIPLYMVRAMQYYAHALEIDPSRDDLRLRLAKLQMFNVPQTALKTAEEILAHKPSEVEALRIKARALDSLAFDTSAQPIKITQVIRGYEDLLKFDTEDVSAAIRLATLKRKHADEEEERKGDKEAANFIRQSADRIIEKLVARPNLSADAYHAHYDYRKTNNVLKQAGTGPIRLDTDLAQAIAINPHHYFARLSAAEDLAQLPIFSPLVGYKSFLVTSPDRLNAADRQLDLAMGINSAEGQTYLGKAMIRVLRDQYPEAIEILEKGIRASQKANPFLYARIAEIQLLLGKWTEAQKTITDMDTAVKSLYKQGDKSTELSEADVVHDLLRSMYYLAPDCPERNPTQALRILEVARRTHQGSRFSYMTYAAMGRIYSEVGMKLEGVYFFHRAVEGSPNSIPIRLAYANTLRSSGYTPESIPQYEQVLSDLPLQPGKVAESDVWSDLARAQLLIQLRINRDDRKWAEFAKTVNRMKERVPETMNLLFFEIADALTGDSRDSKTNALKLLERGSKKFANDPKFWELAFHTFLDLNQLDRAEAAVKKTSELRKADPVDLMSLLKKLREGKSDFRSGQMLVYSLAELVPKKNEDDGEKEELASGGKRPDRRRIGNNVSEAAVQSIEEAFRRKDATELSRLEEQLAAEKGQVAELSRVTRVLRLLLSSGNDAGAHLVEAQQVAADLTNRLPAWDLAWEASGMVAEARHDIVAAEEAFQKSFDLNNRRPSFIHHLLVFLLEIDKPEFASRVLTKIPDVLRNRDEILPIEVAVEVRLNHSQKAIGVAELALQRRPNDVQKMILAGRALRTSQLASELDRAERLLRRAVDDAPSSLEAWINLLHFYVAYTEHPDRPLQTLESALHVRELLVAQSANWTLDSAEPILECICDSAFVPRAKRLAELKGLPNDARWTAAMVLLADRGAATPDFLRELLGDDLRLLGIANLLSASTSNRAGFVDAFAGEVQSASDQVLIARFLLLDGQVDKALKRYRELTKTKPLANHLLEWLSVANALRAKSDVKQAIDTLERNFPNHPKLADARRLSWQTQDKTADEIAAAAKNWIPERTELSPREQIRVIRQFAKLLAARQRLPEAIDYIRDSIMDLPGGELLLAEFLSYSRPQSGESMKIILKSCEQRMSPAGLRALARCIRENLSAGIAIPDDRIDPLSKIVNQQQGETKSELLSAWAYVQIARKKPDDAITLAEQAIRLDPTNGTNWETWARVLATCKPEHPDIAKSVANAITLSGPLDRIVDNKSYVMLVLGRSEEAVRAAEAVCLMSGDETRAIYWQHLASGLEKLQNPRASAVREYAKALAAEEAAVSTSNAKISR